MHTRTALVVLLPEAVRPEEDIAIRNGEGAPSVEPKTDDAPTFAEEESFGVGDVDSQIGERCGKGEKERTSLGWLWIAASLFLLAAGVWVDCALRFWGKGSSVVEKNGDFGIEPIHSDAVQVEPNVESSPFPTNAVEEVVSEESSSAFLAEDTAEIGEETGTQ